jgi:hypothetical protein
MPAKSEAQRRFIFARKGKAWAKRHGYDNKGKLPARVGKKKRAKARGGKRRRKRKKKG